jgi:hypothetical protein
MSVVIDSDNNNVTIVEEAINVTISTGGSDVSAVWGNITGDIEEQTDLIELLDDKVPYTGATTNVDLGEFELKAGQVTLDTSPTGTAAVGTIRWNDTTGTSETTLKGGSVIIKNGVDLVIRVVNKVTPNTTLTKSAYQVVKISGAQGQKLAVGLAQANNDNNSADTIGIVIESIATNQEGFIMTVGSLESINTTGSLQGETWSDGDVLYLSPTVAGRITNVKPVAPSHLVVVGYVEYAHANNGKIYVKIMNGWELGELHDVDTTGATNGQVLKYNGSIWLPGSDTAGISSIATSAPITGGTITTSGTIGITQATGSTDGYLSATDWTTFNSKQAALTLTTSGTSGAATLVGATLNIPQYQAVLTNPVTGTGASGQVAYWSGTGTQTGSNNLFWDNANGRLGIGTSTPTINLQVETSVNSSAGIYTRNSNSGNLAYGYVNANNNLSASIDIRSHSSGHGVWANTGMILTTSGLTGGMVLFASGNVPIAFWTNTVERMRIFGGGNISMGTSSDLSARLGIRGSGTTSATAALLVQNNTPTNLLQVLDNGRISQTLEGSSGSTAFGTSALSVATGANNTAFGANAGLSTTIGVSSSFFGLNAGRNNTSGNSNSFFGLNAGFSNSTGPNNSFFGVSAGQSNTTGSSNSCVGVLAGFNNTTGSNNTFLGYNAGRYITGGATSNTISNNSIFLGYDTRAAADNETNQIVIGYQETGLGSNTTIIGNASTVTTALRGNLLLGTTTTTGARATVRGSGTTSATAALLVQNSTPSELFKVLDNGNANFGTGMYWDNANNKLALGTSTTTSATRLIVQGTTASDIGQLGSELLTTGTGDASWTGTDFATGYTHVAGSTTTLTSTLAAVVNNYYQITYTVTGRTAGTFTIAFGGFTSGNLSATGNVGPRATSTGTLVITPTSDFNGTIVLSVRVISASTPTISFLSSAGTVTNEIRVSDLNTNTFVGRNSGTRNTTGANNTFFGVSAGFSNTTGGGNSFFGVNAGFNNTSGSSNSFFGRNAGQNTTTGSNNTFFGLQAGFSNTTGGGNSFFGRDAGLSNTTGAGNIFFGLQAGFSNTTGAGNIFFGVNAGRYITGGVTANTISNNSIFLGFDTRANADNETNQIVIGYDVVGLGSNTTTIGNASTTNNYIYGNFNITDKNIIFGTTTGTKIGTATSQKLAFWNATPIVQPTTGIAEATFVENSGGTAVNVDSTFAGYTLQQIAQALKDLGILA